MRNLAEQVKRILEVYLTRGEAALEYFHSGDTDQAIEILQNRKAAFHNFRAVEKIAEDRGMDWNEIPDFAGLLSRMQSVDSHLKDEMKKARDLAEVQAKKLNAARRKIGKYRSSVEGQSRFEQSV